MEEELIVEESKVQHIARTAKAAQRRRKTKQEAVKRDDWYEVVNNKIIYKCIDEFGNKSSKYVGNVGQDNDFYQKIKEEGKVR